MLLKCSNLEPGKGKGKLSRASTVMRMTMSTGPTMTSRVHRKVLRIPSKRHPGKALPGKIHSAARIGGKVLPGKRLRPQQNTHCDNSNDSGLGYDQYADTPYANIKQVPSTRLTSSSGAESPTIGRSRLEIEDGRSQNNQYAESYTSSNGINALLTATKCDVPSTSSAINIIDSEMIEADETKPQKFDHKFDIDDTCSNDAFAFNACLKGNPLKSNQKTTTVPCNASKITPISRANNRPAIRRTAIGSQILNAPNNNMGVSGTVTLQTQIGAISQNGKCQLQILAQPEQQHRARYQTEGSRGAVKDRSGNGFPIVKLVSYDKPTTLQIFIGTDVGRVAPHMFYQACKVSGKNSTPCNEKKVEGTIVIEIDLKPDSDMTATCDCVGILKERNVDVEHRFPDQTAGPRSKKKSTRCRMVFRTQITHDDGTIETLQVCSQQIICTSKKPIYTLGYRNVLERLSTTPGPGTYTVTNSTLNQTKAYTFGSRPEQKVRSGTPAPNQYAVDSNFTRTPSFTFGGRRKVEKPNQTPAPGTYSPCNVDTRETFTFNSRPEQKIKSDAPAPNLYAPEKCKQEFKPSFSFGGRHNLEKPNQTPAPGSYAPEKCNLNQQASYSFGLRTEQKLENFAPAPNQYSPEKCKQEFQPAFSFGGRHDTEKPNKTPAPGAYSPEKCHMDYQPAFSFGSRPEEKIKNIAPAPNAYQPEKCNLEHQPAFSFGLRPEEKIRSDSPAPNMYSPEKCKLEHQPAFSFGGRHNTDKPSQTPDPGAYSPEKSNLEFQPAFSFGSRPEEKIKNIAPAPNAYQPEKCNLEHQPAFSFGLRPEEKIRSDSPAPNMYSPEKCKLEHQPAFSFGGRYNTDKPSQTPAPGAYSPEKSNLEHQPAFSFGTRQEEKITNDAPAPNHYQPCKLEHQPAFSFGGRYNTDKHSQTPAPGAYSPEKANLEHQPAFSFGSRPVQKVRSDTPAPSAYAPEKVNLKQTPAFSFGLKIKQERYSETPAPNEYSIPTVLGSSKEAHIRSAPAYTLVGRQKTTQAPSIRFPGPGAYDGHYESVMHKSPHFSMGQRIAKKTKDSGPGPGSHFPEKVNLSHVPAFSFGIRHSAYLGNFTDLKKSAAKKAKY